VRTRLVEKMQEMGLTMHLLAGNHDLFLKNTSDVCSSVEMLHLYPFIKIYTSPTCVNFDGLDIGLVPWINDGNAVATQEFLKTTCAPILFGHFEIAGFQFFSGNVCEKGLDRSIFDRFEAIYSGHFHKRQNDGHIYYIGNCYQKDASDIAEIKGFTVFDTETHTTTFIENPHKLFWKVFYDDKANNYDTNPIDYEKYKQCFVKLVVVNKQSAYTFEKFVDGFYNAGVANLAIVEDLTEKTDAISGEGIADISLDTLSIINTEIDTLASLSESEMAKLKAIIHRVYVEAQSLRERVD
jgi:hypothetical protein